MLRRAACAAFIFYQMVWLGAVVPGHVRGKYTLPGTESAACDQGGGHTCCPGPPAADKHPDEQQQPSPADRARCAVCYFAAGLSTPPALDYDLAPSGLVSVLTPPPPQTFDPVYTPAYYGRGPPAA
jgi:hypothetical protein